MDIRIQNYEEELYKLTDFLICSLTKNSLSLLSLTYCWFWSFFSSTRGYICSLSKDSSSSKPPQPGFRLSTSVKAWYTQQKWLSQGDRARPGGRAQWMSRGPRAEVVRRRGWMGASREAAGARRRGRTVALVYETVRRRPWRILMTTAASLWGTKTKWIFGRNNKGNREGLSRRVLFLDEIPGTNCWRWRIWLVLTRFWHSLLVLQENWTRYASIL